VRTVTDLSPLWVVLTVAAVWRVIVFIRQDSIIDGTREKFVVFLTRKDSLWRSKVLDLIDCPWCLGVWLSAVAVAAWEFAPVEWVAPVVAFLAIAALAAVSDQLADKL